MWMTVSAFAAILATNGATIVIPQELANTAGNGTIGLVQARYQFAYSSSLFSSVGRPLEISAIRLRVDPNAPAFSNTTEMQMAFFTTSQNPEGSRTTPFSGSDAFVALARAPVSWSGNPGLSFDAVVPLPNHFVYDPAAGNLVLDWSVFDRGANPMGFDAQGADDGIDSIVTGLTGGASFWGTGGLVAEFVYTPVPEPSTCALVAGYLLWLMLKKRKHVAS
jgi:hypothetical protein